MTTKGLTYNEAATLQRTGRRSPGRSPELQVFSPATAITCLQYSGCTVVTVGDDGIDYDTPCGVRRFLPRDDKDGYRRDRLLAIMAGGKPLIAR